MPIAVAPTVCNVAELTSKQLMLFMPVISCLALLVCRYHLSTFYIDKEIGVAYSYVSAGTALSQVCLHILLV